MKVGFIAAQNLQIPTAFWRLAHVCRELFVVLAEFGKHIQRRHEIRVVVENALQTCNVPDRKHRRTADFADTPGESALADGNGLLGLYGLRPLRQRDFESALVKGCRYFVGIDGVTKPERPLEAAVAALHEVILLLLPLGLLLALQGEHAVAERDADVLLINPRQLGFDDEIGVRLADIDARHELVAPLTPGRRVEPAKAAAAVSMKRRTRSMQQLRKPSKSCAKQPKRPGKLLPPPATRRLRRC